MATRNLRASDIVGALFDKNLGLGDSETSSDDDEDERIHGYLGSSFFVPSGGDSVPAQDQDPSIGSEDEASHHEDMQLSSTYLNVNDTHQSRLAESVVTGHNEALHGDLANCPMDSTVSATQ